MTNKIFNIVDSRFGSFNHNGMFEITDLKDIDEVILNSYGNLFIKQGNQNILLIETEKTNLANIQILVDNNKLNIQSHIKHDTLKSIFKPAYKLNFHLTLKDLNKLILESSGDTYIQEELNTKAFNICLNASGNCNADSIRAESFIFDSKGSGDLKISKLKASCKSGLMIKGSGNADMKNYETKELVIEINGRGDITIKNIEAKNLVSLLNGSGNLKMSGVAESQTVKSTSSGDYKCKKLTTDTAELDLLGSGDIKVNVKEKVSVNKNGSGDLKIEGNPKIN